MSIKYAILGLLSWKPSTGYELKKIFEESSSMYWSGNNNQIYKALVQLQEEGYVTNETEHQEGLPSKKIYTITKEGIDELMDWVLSSPEAPEFKKPFLIQLAWSDILGNRDLFELLTKYENEVKVRIILHQEKIKRGMDSPHRTPRETFLWHMIDENILSSYKNELEWVKEVRKQLFENELKEEKKRMDYKIIEAGNLKYIELFSCASPVSTEQDILDLVALCGEHETNLIILHSNALSEDFFKLKTGVAGKVMQKFTNYYIKAAVILPAIHDDKGSEKPACERVITGKFKDMVIEANRGNRFRFFQEKEEAEKWLVNN